VLNINRISSYFTLVFKVIFLVWGFVPVLKAQEIVPIDRNFEVYLLRPAHLRDATGSLTLTDILKPQQELQFMPAISPFFSFGADPANWWLRFKVKNTQEVPQRIILRLNRKNFDRFNLWQKEADGSLQNLGAVGVKEPRDPKFVLTDGYFYKLVLKPGEETEFIGMAYNRVGSMHLGLSLENPDYFAKEMRIDVLGFGLFMGIMILTILFSGFLFMQYRDKIYLFYIVYVLNILLREAHEYSADFGMFPLFQRHAVSVLIAATFSLFFRHFILLWTLNPRLDKIVKVYSYLIFILVPGIIFLTIYDQIETLKWIFFILNFVNLIFTLLALWVALRYFKTSLRARILTVAYLPLAFAFVAILLRNMNIIGNYPIIQHAVMWGFVLEVMAFTTGFSIWYHQMERESKVLKLNLILEKQQKQIEINEAEQKVKDHIARDLHDDIAATMSGIQLMSKIAATQFAPKMPEAAPILEQINKSAIAVSDSISELIWTVKQHEDYLNDIADRIREHASKVLEINGIECQINIPRNLPVVQYNLETKRNVHLVYKEAMNNALKYSKCTKMTISLNMIDNRMSLTVADNGIGFDLLTVKLGNGLKNLKTRAQNVGAFLEIKTEVGNGTSINLIV
jgi:signal transduction histidine kinase